MDFWSELHKAIKTRLLPLSFLEIIQQSDTADGHANIVAYGWLFLANLDLPRDLDGCST